MLIPSPQLQEPYMRELSTTRGKTFTNAMTAMAWLLLCIGSSYAQKPVPAAPPQGGTPTAPPQSSPMGPPPETLAACKSAKLHQACNFTSPRGAEKGSCWQPDASKPLACRPERKGPPPESLAACKNLKAMDNCSFVTPEGLAKGICTPAGDAASALGCRPKRR